jgi:hypothetical protein
MPYSSKCEVVVFAKNCRAWTGFGDWKVKDKALPRFLKFKYLGVELHDVTGTKDSVEHRLSPGPGSWLVQVAHFCARMGVLAPHIVNV